MIKVSSKVVLNMGLIKQLSQAQVEALEKTGEALHTEVVQSQVMPRDTGTLQNEKTFVDHSASSQGIITIASEGPYARRLYFHPEYDFQTFENAFAGGEWYKPWLPGGAYEDFAVKAFQKFYKKETGL